MFPCGETEAQDGEELAKVIQQCCWDLNPGLSKPRFMHLLHLLPSACPHRTALSTPICTQPALMAHSLLLHPRSGSIAPPALCTRTWDRCELGFFLPRPHPSPCGPPQQPPSRPERREGHLPRCHQLAAAAPPAQGPAGGGDPRCSPGPSSGCG